jgi:Flp pilus assembly pilin Flp
MSVFTNMKRTVRRFKKDESGSFVTVWGVGLLLTLTAIGTGVDLVGVSRVKGTAQSAADQVALAAAVFYSQHERMPESRDEGYMHETIYYGSESGFSFPASVKGGDEGVEILVNYDRSEGHVTVDVSGETETALMGIFGIDTLPFRSVARARFKETEIKNPASITMVLDNSGSMGWDDTPAECTSSSVWSCSSPSQAMRRIDGLTDSVTNFMGVLNNFSGSQAVSGKRVLRTGMIPYDDAIINNREVRMKWGTVSQTAINRMAPSGSTNSAPPIARAWEWLQAENQVHENETGNSDPLRYMIFMTDGQNSDAPQWIQESGTNYWRGIDCSRGRYCYYTYKNSTSRPNIRGTYGWTEGKSERRSDAASKNTCQAMKDQGVRVFTIGYALEPGTYMTNYPASWGAGNRVRTISQATTNSAYALLSDCASSGQDFVPAEDTDTLEEAFELIGQTIVEDVVRLSQ